MGRLGTRDAGEATASPRRSPRPAPAARRRDDPLRHRRRRPGASRASSSPASSPGRSRCARATDGLLLHAANSAATLGIPEARLDLVRCGIAALRDGPVRRRPGASTAWSPRSSCAPTSPRSSRSRRGRARATAAASSRDAPTWIGTVPIGYGGRRAARADERLRRAGRRPPRAGGRHGLDGQHHRRPRARAAGAAAREVVLLGAQGGERVLAEEWARRLGTINYEITCGISARVPRAHHRGGAPA